MAYLDRDYLFEMAKIAKQVGSHLLSSSSRHVRVKEMDITRTRAMKEAVL
jgi:hypothetical protein